MSSPETEIGRVVGVDLGDKRIGIAVCDEARSLATPYATIKRSGDMNIEHSAILNVASEIQARTIVIGLPRSLDGSQGLTAEKVLSEIRVLDRNIEKSGLSVDVVTVDERFTTVIAQGSLRIQKVKGKKNKQVVDQVAAAVILQSWLDSNF